MVAELRVREKILILPIRTFEGRNHLRSEHDLEFLPLGLVKVLFFFIDSVLNVSKLFSTSAYFQLQNIKWNLVLSPLSK
jgi:hypothetical protein